MMKDDSFIPAVCTALILFIMLGYFTKPNKQEIVTQDSTVVDTNVVFDFKGDTFLEILGNDTIKYYE
jgi:hypothetical protein